MGGKPKTILLRIYCGFNHLNWGYSEDIQTQQLVGGLEHGFYFSI